MTEKALSWFRRNAALISLASALLLQGGATIWWTAVLSQRVSEVEQKVAKNTVLVDQIPVMQSRDDQIIKLLDKISSDVFRLNDRLWEHHQATSKQGGK